jgi:hypothetical protein
VGPRLVADLAAARMDLGARRPDTDLCDPHALQARTWWAACSAWCCCPARRGVGQGAWRSRSTWLRSARTESRCCRRCPAACEGNGREHVRGRMGPHFTTRSMGDRHHAASRAAHGHAAIVTGAVLKKSAASYECGRVGARRWDQEGDVLVLRAATVAACVLLVCIASHSTGMTHEGEGEGGCKCNPRALTALLYAMRAPFPCLRYRDGHLVQKGWRPNRYLTTSTHPFRNPSLCRNYCVVRGSHAGTHGTASNCSEI